jgi:hypothetical protein
MFCMRNKSNSDKGMVSSSKDETSDLSARRVLMDTVIGARSAAKKSRCKSKGRYRDPLQDSIRYNMMSLKRMHDFALQDVESVCSNA